MDEPQADAVFSREAHAATPYAQTPMTGELPELLRGRRPRLSSWETVPRGGRNEKRRGRPCLDSTRRAAGRFHGRAYDGATYPGIAKRFQRQILSGEAA